MKIIVSFMEHLLNFNYCAPRLKIDSNQCKFIPVLKYSKVDLGRFSIFVGFKTTNLYLYVLADPPACECGFF